MSFVSLNGGIEVVSLDWSGVISDDRMPVYEANMKILEEHGKPRTTFDEWISSGASNAGDFLRSIGIDKPWEQLDALFKERLNQVVEEGIVVPFVYPDAKKVCGYLHDRGLTLTVVSAHPEKNLREEAERYGLSAFYKGMYAGARNKSAVLRQMCADLERHPSDVLYVGDHVNDIRHGKAAGVRTAGISTGYHKMERLAAENPDFRLTSLSDLMLIF